MNHGICLAQTGSRIRYETLPRVTLADLLWNCWVLCLLSGYDYRTFW